MLKNEGVAMQQLSTDKVRNLLAQPNGADKLNEKPESALQAAWELFALEGNAAACGFLCACIKKKAIKENIALRLSEDRSPLYAALKSEASKMRKNAARLCGALGNPEDEAALIEALKQEDTRYVRPSLILALGAVGGAEATKTLMNYIVEDGDPKHMSAEKEALMMARARCIHVEEHHFCAPKKAMDVELRAPKWLSEELAYELREIGFTPRRVFTEAVTVKTSDIEGLYKARSFFEILFPLGKCDKTITSITEAAAPFSALLESCHDGKPPFAYRIEIKGTTADRAGLAKALATKLDDEKLHNAPSDYEAELRVEIGAKNVKLYAKLYTIKDTRFSYRKEALPASIHPATAAAVIRTAREYMKADARVLDICCGSGTMLFEREKYMPCATLTGVDIAHKAIDAARENAKEGESKAKFIVNDALRFKADRPFDEIISNLPFGNRVGSHDENKVLYAGILERLPEWLNKDGVAVLYTMEFTLLKKLLKTHEELELMAQAKTDAGGLMPGIFIIKRK